MKDPYKETIISINKSGNPTFMTTSKSIEEIIKDEAESFIKNISPPLDAILRDEDYSIVRQAIKSTYIAGRSQNLAREKEYREALEEAALTIEALYGHIGSEGNIETDSSYNKIKQLLKP